jgi:hypothetical protein
MIDEYPIRKDPGVYDPGNEVAMFSEAYPALVLIMFYFF